MLADEFVKGACEAGHDVEEIDAAHSEISPCIGVFTAVMRGNVF